MKFGFNWPSGFRGGVLTLWTKDGGRRRRRTPEHGFTISSSCEPEGSGELKSKIDNLG